MPLVIIDTPEQRWAGLHPEIGQGNLSQPFIYFGVWLSRGRQTGEITFNVGGEDRYSKAGKTLGEHLQGHGFPGPGRTGDQPVPVAHPGQLLDKFAIAGTQIDQGNRHSYLLGLY